MAKKKFTPILGDLSKLTKEQQEEYVLAACEFLQVPPELGLVGLSLMDTGDGARQLLLYVKRGATDIIRDRLKISVDKLEPSNGDGYVGWIATGSDANKRQEIAVGAVSIKGISGVAVANAVKTSQTQALRRMTLQFAGGGFLDVTELNEKTTDIVNSSQSLAAIAAQPSVMVNSQAGKDITGQVISQVENVPSQVSNDTQNMTDEPRKKRRRNTVSLDSPSVSELSQEELEPLPQADVKAVLEVQKVIATPVVNDVTSNLEAAKQAAIDADKPSDNGTLPTPEQKKQFREQLSSYVNDILPKAGFLQSEKLGSRNDKMKMFMNKMFPKADTKILSVQQWDSFFLLMSSKMQELGVTELVKFIDKTIGEGA